MVKSINNTTKTDVELPGSVCTLLVITQQNRLAHHIIMMEMMMEDFIGTDFQLYVLVFNVAGWQRPNSFPCQC